MDIRAIRYHNFLRLIEEAGSVAELARRANASEGYLLQIKNKHIAKERKSPKQVGDDLARDLEEGMNKPAGWMDVQHDDELPPDVAAFLDQVQAEVAARDIPDHIMQSVLTLISSSPKKTN